MQELVIPDSACDKLIDKLSYIIPSKRFTILDFTNNPDDIEYVLRWSASDELPVEIDNIPLAENTALIIRRDKYNKLWFDEQSVIKNYKVCSPDPNPIRVPIKVLTLYPYVVGQWHEKHSHGHYVVQRVHGSLHL